MNLIKEQLRAGAGLRAAAEAAGCRQSSVTKRADRDSELAALLAVDGIEDRTWINKAVFLAALMACGGVPHRAADRIGITQAAVVQWKKDPPFAAAADAVAALAVHHLQNSTAEAFEQFLAEVRAGSTMAQAARKCGLSVSTLRRFGMQNETLAQRWEDAKRERMRIAGAPRPLARKPLDEQQVRELWGDYSLGVHSIAAKLGVSYPTLKKRARNLGLPDRRADRPQGYRFAYDRSATAGETAQPTRNSFGAVQREEGGPLPPMPVLQERHLSSNACPTTLPLPAPA